MAASLVYMFEDTSEKNYLIWFQYKLIHRVLGTQRLLYKMGKSLVRGLFIGSS